MLDLERRELEALAHANDGKLTVDDVVAAASKKDSALHKHFTWDNRKAASEYRRYQARALIARVKITVLNPDPVVVRAFVSLSEDRKNGGYTATTEVLGDESKRQSLINDILKRIAYWRQQSRLFASAELNVAINQLEAAALSQTVPTEVREAA